MISISTSGVLGIFNFLYKIFKQPIDIEIKSVGYRFRERDDAELSHHYGELSEQLPKYIPRLLIDFILCNKTEKPIGIKYIRIEWISPKIIEQDDYSMFVNKATEFITDSLTDPFELKNLPISIENIFEPSAFLTIALSKMNSDISSIKAELRIFIKTKQKSNKKCTMGDRSFR